MATILHFNRTVAGPENETNIGDAPGGTGDKGTSDADLRKRLTEEQYHVTYAVRDGAAFQERVLGQPQTRYLCRCHQRRAALHFAR